MPQQEPFDLVDECPNAMPAVWGPLVWRILHALPLVIDFSDPGQVNDVLEELLSMELPCNECTQHARRFLECYPPEEHFSDSRQAFYYLFRMHQHVDVRMKSIRRITLHAAKLIHSSGCNLEDLFTRKRVSIPHQTHALYRLARGLYHKASA